MRLLIVEDDPKMARLIRRGLHEEGAVVDVAGRGEDAVWMASSTEYDALVLDVMLPGIDGYELCRRLRAAGNWTPILMLTAKSGDDDEAHALDTGADDFLAKPFSYVVLLARIRALLRRRGRDRPAVVTAGDLVLDPASHQVRRGEIAVDLTPRQFALLEVLMRRAGEVLPKREILEHVWDFTFDGDPNIVEVYVRQLRTRIDLPFGRAAIQTVRGAGYRLDPGGG